VIHFFVAQSKIVIYTVGMFVVFLLLARYVNPNIEKRSIWYQCNIEDRPTTDWPTNDRPLFLEEPSWKKFKWPYLYNGAR